jgi:hypothetical protein
MSGFTDLVLLQFQQPVFVTNFLTNELGLDALFASTYTVEDVIPHNLTLSAVTATEFEMPAFETIRQRGSNEKITSGSEIVKVDRTYYRAGRLAWVDVYLDVTIGSDVESQFSAIQSITAEDLVTALGPVNTLGQLKTKLGTLYPPSIVDAFFTQLSIHSIEDFTAQPGLFLKFVFAAPAPFVAGDPANAKTFRLNVCAQIQNALAVSEALQSAKLCRGMLESNNEYARTFTGGEIETPFAMVAIFPDSLVVNNAIGSLTAAQIRTGIQQLFANEKMFAQFV